MVWLLEGGRRIANGSGKFKKRTGSAHAAGAPLEQMVNAVCHSHAGRDTAENPRRLSRSLQACPDQPRHRRWRVVVERQQGREFVLGQLLHPHLHILGRGQSPGTSAASPETFDIAERVGHSRSMRLPSTTPQPAAFNAGSTCSALVSASFMASVGWVSLVWAISSPHLQAA